MLKGGNLNTSEDNSKKKKKFTLVIHVSIGRGLKLGQNKKILGDGVKYIPTYTLTLHSGADFFYMRGLCIKHKNLHKVTKIKKTKLFVPYE